MSHFSDARDVIAGGVNSPVRAFAGVGGEPLFFKSASGALLESEDGGHYVDYVGSWGPMILGHGHPAVINAVIETAQSGLSFGAPCVLETRIARKIRELVPSMQRLRMVSSGTEATMSAIRLARGHTGSNKIFKFEDREEIDNFLTDMGYEVSVPENQSESRDKDWRSYYNARTYNLVAEWYREDINRFGYGG